MANNIVSGKNGGLGISTANFDDVAAITAQSVLIIKQYLNGQTLTWKKGRQINGVSAFSVDGQFVVIATTGLDLTANMATKAADFPNSAPVPFFEDNFVGPSGTTYSNHAPDHGQAVIQTGSGLGPGVLDGNGNLDLGTSSLPAVLDINVISGQTRPSPRKLTYVLAQAPGSSVLTALRYQAANDQFYGSFLKNNDGSIALSFHVITPGSNGTSVDTPTGTTATITNPVYPLTVVLTENGNAVTMAAGGQTITATASGATKDAQIVSFTGAKLASVKEEAA